MNVVLIGFMGVGKTTVGRAVARRLAADFVDTDAEIERIEGMPISLLFVHNGEEYFRQAETSLLRRIADSTTGDAVQRPIVVSTGGGLPLREENRLLVKQIGPVIWLRASSRVIARRVSRHAARRPLISGHLHDLNDHICELLAKREPSYASMATHVVESDDLRSAEHVASSILAKLSGFEPADFVNTDRDRVGGE